MPVVVNGKQIFTFFLVLQAFLFVFGELAPGSNGGTAYSAHPAGLLIGWAYHRWLMAKLPLWERLRDRFRKPISVSAPAWEHKKSAVAASGGGKFTLNLGGPSAVRREVDRILDKINEQGFGALTEEEKRVLDRAKDSLK